MPDQGAHRYDKILKENLERFILYFAENVLKLPIQHSQILDPKLQTTIEREPDVLRLVKPQNGEPYILQIEFQTYDQKDMVYRMAEYKAILQRKYQLPVQQYVIYLGKGLSKMSISLPPAQRINDFQLLHFSHFRYTDFLHAGEPEIIILAILSDFLGHDPEFVITQILEQLKSNTTSPEDLKKYLLQLNVLAQLPKLDKLIDKKIITMPISIDIRENAMYKRVMKEEKEKIIERMILLHKLSSEEIATATDSPLEIVEAIKKGMDTK